MLYVLDDGGLNCVVVEVERRIAELRDKLGKQRLREGKHDVWE